MNFRLPLSLRGNGRFEKPLRREAGRPGFEEAGGPGAPGRKDYTRADSDNWRTLREEQEEDEGEPGTTWRHGGPRRDGTAEPVFLIKRHDRAGRQENILECLLKFMKLMEFPVCPRWWSALSRLAGPQRSGRKSQEEVRLRLPGL